VTGVGETENDGLSFVMFLCFCMVFLSGFAEVGRVDLYFWKIGIRVVS
jgi:hypothetical protein